MFQLSQLNSGEINLKKTKIEEFVKKQFDLMNEIYLGFKL